MGTYRPTLTAAVLGLVLTAGIGGAAAEPTPAGVVTSLRGEAVVTRASLPDPAPLAFRDDVFRRDQIDTRADSAVRILLGGRALVTVRELSTFTVTEEPGRAIVDLTSGRLALGLAKALMKKGEVIEVHTPNAIAAIRGSLLVAEVTFQNGVPYSRFTAIEASVPIVISLRDNPALEVGLQPTQAVDVLGTSLGPVQTLPTPAVQQAARVAQLPETTTSAPEAPKPVVNKIAKSGLQEAAAVAKVLTAPAGTQAATAADPSNGNEGEAANVEGKKTRGDKVAPGLAKAKKGDDVVPSALAEKADDLDDVKLPRGPAKKADDLDDVKLPRGPAKKADDLDDVKLPRGLAKKADPGVTAPTAPAPTTAAPAVAAPAPAVSAPAPTVSAPAPTVAAPTPTVSAPTPTIAAPAPTVSAPTPVIAAPTPVISAPTPTVSAPRISPPPLAADLHKGIGRGLLENIVGKGHKGFKKDD